MADKNGDKITVEKLLSDKFQESDLQGLKFEAGVALLEELTNLVEEGELPLEQSLTAYERGSMIASQLRKVITGAEERLKIIKKKSSGEIDQELFSEPGLEEETLGAANPKTKSKKSSRRGASFSASDPGSDASSDAGSADDDLPF